MQEWISAGKVNFFMQKRAQCKSEVFCSAIAAMVLIFLFKSLFEMCFLEISLKPHFVVLLPFCKPPRVVIMLFSN